MNASEAGLMFSLDFDILKLTNYTFGDKMIYKATVSGQRVAHTNINMLDDISSVTDFDMRNFNLDTWNK